MSSNDCDGVTLTWAEFLHEAEEFTKVAKKLNDNWELIRERNDAGGAYLVFKQKTSLCATAKDELVVAEIESSELVEDVVDDSVSTELATAEMLTLEYHVVYSVSYQVPMLLLQANKRDGKLLQLEEAWQLFETSSAADGLSFQRSDLLGILTPIEHPVTNRPFYGIHPCRTAALLAQAGKSSNHILTFLSLIGPFLKLHLQNDYGKEF